MILSRIDFDFKFQQVKSNYKIQPRNRKLSSQIAKKNRKFTVIGFTPTGVQLEVTYTNSFISYFNFIPSI